MSSAHCTVIMQSDEHGAKSTKARHAPGLRL